MHDITILQVHALLYAQYVHYSSIIHTAHTFVHKLIDKHTDRGLNHSTLAVHEFKCTRIG